MFPSPGIFCPVGHPSPPLPPPPPPPISHGKPTPAAPVRYCGCYVPANGCRVIKTLMASVYQFIMSCTPHSLRAVSCCRDHEELILRGTFSRNHEIIVSLGWLKYIIIKRSPAPVSGCPFWIFYKQVNQLLRKYIKKCSYSATTHMLCYLVQLLFVSQITSCFNIGISLSCARLQHIRCLDTVQ